MLAFLKKDKENGSASSSEPIKRSPDREVDYDVLESAAQDLLDAFKKEDVRGIAIALRAAFELCDASPHFEGPHLEEGEG